MQLSNLTSIVHFPFHTSIFQDVPAHKRILFKLYLCSFGPVVLSLRFICAIFISSIIREPRIITSPLFYSGVLNWFVSSDVVNDHIHKLEASSSEGTHTAGSNITTIASNQEHAGDINGDVLAKDSKRPLAFFFNHHCTYDPWFVKLAIRKQFDLHGKIMVKNNVYNNRYLSIILGRNAIRNFFITSNHNLQRFIDIYRDWIKSTIQSVSKTSSSTSISEETSSSIQNSNSRECLMLAPSGMTTHSKYQTPMYWEYFSEKDVEKVMVHVDVRNPFGLNLRSISTSITLSQLLCGIMPWLSIHVTFYPNVFARYDKENCLIASQDDADSLVTKLYTEKHDMIFCPDWKLGQRRKVDRYLEYGEYNIFNPHDKSTERKNDVLIIDVDEDHTLSERKKSIPDTIKIVTSSLSGNHKVLDQIDTDLQPHEILLWNPSDQKDRMIAAAFDILMYLPVDGVN